MIVIDGETVRRLLPMADAVELMRDTFRRYSGGRVVQPVRHMVRSPGGEVLAVMPAHVAAPEATAQPDAGYGLKTVLIKPDNAARGLPVHVGLVLVFDPDTGLPAALIDAAALTAIRTAAASAAATDALARPDATVLAVLGAGVQARSHLRAMGAVRPVKEVRVWNHRPASAHALADWARDQLDLDVTVADTVPAAVADADVICTVTAADEPVLSAAPVAEGRTSTPWAPPSPTVVNSPVTWWGAARSSSTAASRPAPRPVTCCSRRGGPLPDRGGPGRGR